MLPSWISTSSSIGMAVVPPLVGTGQHTSTVEINYYLLGVRRPSLLNCSQEVSISRLYPSSPSYITYLNRDATGFSRDVCAILSLLIFFHPQTFFDASSMTSG
jgi:hypothetical protein